MTRIAAFDCGTNSVRLLIAERDAQGRLHDIVRELKIVRLGEGVDRTGRFSAEALERTLEAIRGYAKSCREHGVERIRFVATSATRDAANRDQFTEAVREILGSPVEVISGVEEAALSFRGALTALQVPDGAGRGAAAGKRDDSERPGNRLVVDLGGGSTELVLGVDRPDSAFSMNVGSVRLTERNIHGDPLSDADAASIRRDVNSALDAAARAVALEQTLELIGVAGTITTVTAHALGLDTYDPAAIHGSRLPLTRLVDACESISRLPRAARAALPYLHPGRVDVIPAGATMWSSILRRVADVTSAVGRPIEFVTTSEHDILDGVALSLGPDPDSAAG